MANVKGGTPPPEYQCQARLKRKGGAQCKKWALRGAKYCQFHGGRRSRGQKVIPLGDLPVFYGGVLNATLQQAVANALDTEPHEQLNLFEELALTRVVCSEAVGLYSAACESNNKEARLAAASIMQDALGEVVRTCEAASRVNAAGSDKISVHNIAHVVRQMTRIAAEVMSEDQARAFDALVKERIKISAGAQGTSSTPDQDALDMDATIPGGPDDD